MAGGRLISGAHGKQNEQFINAALFAQRNHARGVSGELP
jgi:hypothetical protein